MRRRLCLLLLLLPLTTWGQRGPQVWMAWELDLEGHAPPSHFVLSVRSEAGRPVPPAMEVPWATCTTVPGAQHCAPLGCPPQDTYIFEVRAQYAEGLSAPANPYRCTIVAGVCQCREDDRAPPASVPVARPPAAPPPPHAPPFEPVTTPPPLPQRGPEGLNLQPVGDLPPLPIVPPIPASGAV